MHAALQTVRQDRTLVNYTAFGRLLRAVAQDCRSVLHRHGRHHGFQDGGCWMFAEALCRWSGQALVLAAVYAPHQPAPQHIVATWQNHIYLDSDGLAMAQDLCWKMAALEKLPHAFVDRFDPQTCPGIEFDEVICTELVAIFCSRLGPFDPQRLSLS